MYIPRHDAETDPSVLLAEMQAQAAATLVSHGPDGMVATHVPVEVVAEPAPYGRVRCHLARKNPHADVMAAGGEVLLIFQGVEGYVSPSHYPSKKTNEGKVVPTWAYVAIHAYGKPAVFEGPEALRPHIAALSDRHEAGRAEPWGLDDAPADFIDMLCNAIIGFDIPLDRIEGKWKLGVHRPPADREGTEAGLRAEGQVALADRVASANAKRGNG